MYKRQLDDSLRIMTYNIGYAGLDKSEDFFMDGGSEVQPDSKEPVSYTHQMCIRDSIGAFLNPPDNFLYFFLPDGNGKYFLREYRLCP